MLCSIEYKSWYWSWQKRILNDNKIKNILKEVYFTSHNITERFIKFIFGEKFFTQEKYITEISYNKLKSPISYKIKSTRDEYIGHIIMNYDKNNNLIRETWFQNKKKIKEFVKWMIDNKLSQGIYETHCKHFFIF